MEAVCVCIYLKLGGKGNSVGELLDHHVLFLVLFITLLGFCFRSDLCRVKHSTGREDWIFFFHSVLIKLICLKKIVGVIIMLEMRLCCNRWLVAGCEQVLQNDIDLLHPPADLEKRKHKLKRLVQSPNSFFMVLILIFR